MSGETKSTYRYHSWVFGSVARILVRIFVLSSILELRVDSRPNSQEEPLEISQSIHLPQLSQLLLEQDKLLSSQHLTAETPSSAKSTQHVTYAALPANFASNQKNSPPISSPNQLYEFASTRASQLSDFIGSSYSNNPVKSGYSIQPQPISGLPRPEPSRSALFKPSSNMEQYKALRLPVKFPSDTVEFLQYAKAKSLDMQMVERFLGALAPNIDTSELVRQSEIAGTPNLQSNVPSQEQQRQPQQASGYSDFEYSQTKVQSYEQPQSENVGGNRYSQIPNFQTDIPFSELLTQRDNIQVISGPRNQNVQPNIGPNIQNSEKRTPPQKEIRQPEIRPQIENQLPVSEQLPVFQGIPDFPKQSKILNSKSAPEKPLDNNLQSIKTPRVEIQAPQVERPVKIPAKFPTIQPNLLTPPHVYARPQIELQVPAHPEPPRLLQVPSEDAFLNHIANSIKNMVLISEQRESKPKPRPGGTKIIGLTAPKKQTPTEAKTKRVDPKISTSNRIANRPPNGEVISSPTVDITTKDSNYDLYVLPEKDKTVSPQVDADIVFKTPQELTNGRGPTGQQDAEKVNPNIDIPYNLPLPNESEQTQDVSNGQVTIGQQNVPEKGNTFPIQDQVTQDLQNGRGPFFQNIETIRTVQPVVSLNPNVFQIGNPIGVLHPGGDLITLTPFVFNTATSNKRQTTESAAGTNRVETISSTTPTEFQNQQTASAAEFSKEARTLSVTLPNSATGFLYIQVGPHQPQSFVPATPPVIPGFLVPSPVNAPVTKMDANVPAAPAPESTPSPPQIPQPIKTPAPVTIPEPEIRPEETPNQYDDTSKTYFGGEEIQLIPPTITQKLRRPFVVSTPGDDAVQINCNINGRSIPCATVKQRSQQRPRVVQIIPGTISHNLPGTRTSLVQSPEVFPENGVNELEIISYTPDAISQTGPPTTSDIDVAQLDCLIRPAGLTRIPCATIKSIPRRPNQMATSTGSYDPSSPIKVDCAVTPGLGLSKIPCATITSVSRAKPTAGNIVLNYPSIFPGKTVAIKQVGHSSTEASRLPEHDTLTSESIESSTVITEGPGTGTSPIVVTESTSTTRTTASTSGGSEAVTGGITSVSEAPGTGTSPINTLTKPIDIGESNLKPETESTTSVALETGSADTVPSETGSSISVPSETTSTITTTSETINTSDVPSETNNTGTVTPETGSTVIVPPETGTSPMVISPEAQMPDETVNTGKDVRSTSNLLPVTSVEDVSSTLDTSETSYKNLYTIQLDCFIKEYMFKIPCATST